MIPQRDYHPIHPLKGIKVIYIKLGIFQRETRGDISQPLITEEYNSNPIISGDVSQLNNNLFNSYGSADPSLLSRDNSYYKKINGPINDTQNSMTNYLHEN
jgi:hypothetical protein